MDLHQLIAELLMWSLGVQGLYQRMPQAQIYAAIGIVVLTALFLAIYSSDTAVRLFKYEGRKASKTVVLVGLSGSGKTFLFHQLRDGSTPQGTAVTSMEPNDDTFVLFSERTKKRKIKPVRVVDIPGDIRLRSKLNEFLAEASAIVFVIDAVKFLPNWHANSEYLYELLNMECVVEKKIPVLILSNKVDRVEADFKDFIQEHLERRIGMIQSGDVTNDFIPRKPFTFSQCHSRVTFGESSALKSEIYEVEDFIREPRKFGVSEKLGFCRFPVHLFHSFIVAR